MNWTDTADIEDSVNWTDRAYIQDGVDWQCHTAHVVRAQQQSSVIIAITPRDITNDVLMSLINRCLTVTLYGLFT